VVRKMRDKLKRAVSEMPRAFWLLWVGTLINRLGGFVAPFLSLYLTGPRGVSVTQATLVISLFGVGSFISMLAGGALSDRLGRRPVLLASFLGTPVVMLTLGLVRSLPAIGAASLLVGFFTDLYRPAVSAAVADLVPSERRTRAFGYIYWSINLGAAVAPVVAGLLAHYGYFLLFAGDAATTFLFGLLVLWKLKETMPEHVHPEHHDTEVRRRSFSLLRRDPFFLVFVALTFVLTAIYVQSYSTLPIAMSARGIGPGGYGAAISVNGLLIVVLGIPLARLIERWKKLPAIAGAALLLAVGFGLGRFPGGLALFITGIIIWTLGEIINATVAPAFVAGLAPEGQQGMYQGVYGSAWGLSIFVGPAVGGWVLGTFGAAALWTGCFAVAVAAAACYLMLSRAAVHRE